MAVDEINAAGGVNGKKIELIIEDTTGKPDVGRSAIEKLISRDKVIVLGGGYSSSVTWATVAVAQQRKVPFLVNTGSADRITEQGWQYIFRLNPPVSEYPKAFGSFLETVAKDVKTVVILHENSLFGQSGSKKFAKTCKEMGLKVLMKEGYEAGAIDFKPLLVKVKDKNPDLVYMISYIMDASLLMRQSKELNFNPKLFVGGAAGFTLPEFEKMPGPPLILCSPQPSGPPPSPTRAPRNTMTNLSPNTTPHRIPWRRSLCRHVCTGGRFKTGQDADARGA